MIEQYSYGQNIAPNLNNNVIEKYKSWWAEEVRADLDKKRSDMVCIFENTDHNINIACGIRANNAFLGKEVYIVGRKRYDKRSAVGTHHYETVYHADTLKEVIDRLHQDGYTVFAVDNIDEYNPKNIWDIDLPIKSAFVFGNEGDGLSANSIKLCDDMVYIAQYGSVRSLNVACAAAVIMAEYTRQLNQR